MVSLRGVVLVCRSPCGERGLKLPKRGTNGSLRWVSLPVRGAWIEMFFCKSGAAGGSLVAPRAGSVD